MNKKELEKHKKELMKPGWTEDLHHALEELQTQDAKEIVESMTDSEIYRKVNNRQFQEDYISDYLEYLWEISESAYWKHVIISLDLKVGILWGDHMSHFEKLCNHKIPDNVLKAVLDFALEIDVKENYKQDFEAIGCVVKAQVAKFNRLDEIKKHILSLAKDKQNNADKRINEMINCKCNYQFY